MGSTKRKVTDCARQNNSHQEPDQENVAVLPSKDFVSLQVFYVLDDFLALVDHDPPHVCPHESFLDRVRIFFLVGLEVMTSVVTAPFDGRILEGCCTEQSIEQTHWPRRFVSAMAE